MEEPAPAPAEGAEEEERDEEEAEPEAEPEPRRKSYHYLYLESLLWHLSGPLQRNAASQPIRDQARCASRCDPCDPDTQRIPGVGEWIHC